jgi:CspA family cold shock protein
MPVRETGTVMWFDASKCYGLISRDKGGDILVGYSSFREEGSCLLVKGSRVEFVVVQAEQDLKTEDLIVIE